MTVKYPQHQWFLNDPDELVTYIYWLQHQMPLDREAAQKEIAEQLDRKFPCPDIHRKKWGFK